MAGAARKRGAGGTVLKAAAGLNLVTNYLLTIILLMSTGEMGAQFVLTRTRRGPVATL